MNEKQLKRSLCETGNHNWTRTVNGTTVKGNHLHVWKCMNCLIIDFKEETE